MTDRDVDVTVGAHSFLDALATASFKLGCGCSVRMSTEPHEAYLTRQPGSDYPCTKHGDQIITRTTTRLVGWRKTPTGRIRPPIFKGTP